MKSMNSTILVISISAAAISLAMAVNEIPAIWSCILPWLRPPYLHIVINVIIIAIVAASRFRRSHPAPAPHLISAKTPPPAYYAAYSSPPEVRDVAEVPEAAVVYDGEDRVVELKPVMVNGFEVESDAEEEDAAGGEDDDALGGSTLMYNTPSPERFSPEYQPPANTTGSIPERESTWKKAREGASRATNEEVRRGGAGRASPERHRRNTRKSKSFRERSVYNDSPPSHAKSSQSWKRQVERSLATSAENNAIGDIPPKAEEEEYETMESAWKKISDGASRAAVGKEVYMGPPLESLRKSSSFKERPIYSELPTSSGIRKEVSPSQDELNRRVEAFIKKVNDEIRLRRQNSSNQYTQLNSAA